MKRNKTLWSLPVLALAVMIALPQSAEAKRKWEIAVDDLNARLERIERLLDSQGLQEMYQRLELLDQENRTLRGEVEQLTYQLEHMQERNRQLYLDMDQRLQAFETGQAGMGTSSMGMVTGGELSSGETVELVVPETGAAMTGSQAAVGETSGMAAPSVVASGDEQSVYRAAFEELKMRDYKSAMMGFENFLKSYPQSSLSPNAQYWLGESAYGAGAYKRAANEFEKVIRLYPDSGKKDDAALKLGYSYYELREWGKARTVLKDLMMKSSGSTVGKLAAERLKRMKREGH